MTNPDHDVNTIALAIDVATRNAETLKDLATAIHWQTQPLGRAELSQLVGNLAVLLRSAHRENHRDDI